MHELSLSERDRRHGRQARRRPPGDASSACASAACARSCPTRSSSTSSSSRAARVCEGARLEQEVVPARAALRRVRARVGDRRSRRSAARRAAARDVARRQRQRVRGRVDRGRGGGRMHRTKVRVVEDALDANNTIARANRDDFDRAGVTRRQPHERPGAGKTTLLERVAGGPRRACASACSRATCRARSTPTGSPRLHVPVTQLNTDPGFGGECHLDANMVRSALPRAAARRDRPAGDRERRQPRLPGRVPGRRGRAGDGRVGHRGRGQAAQVPADVPHLRARAGQQDRPAPAPRLRPRPVPATTSTRCTRASSGCS